MIRVASSLSVFVTDGVDGRPNRENKAAFSHFSCLVKRGPKSTMKKLLPRNRNFMK